MKADPENIRKLLVANLIESLEAKLSIVRNEQNHTKHALKMGESLKFGKVAELLKQAIQTLKE